MNVNASAGAPPAHPDLAAISQPTASSITQPRQTSTRPGLSSLTLQLNSYLALTKPRIVVLLLVTTLPAMFLAHQGVPATSLMLATVIGGALAAMGANAANMVLDRDIDAIMERTQQRPLPAGQLATSQAVALAIILEAAALAVFAIWVNWLSAVLSLGAAAFYIVVYTLWLKRRSPSNIVIGGAAGAVPPMVGWAAVTNTLGWEPLALFALIFFWTPPHFWALAEHYKEDYRAAGVPMLPVVAEFRAVANRMLVYVIVVAALSLAFIPIASMSWIYTLAASVLAAGFLAYAVVVRLTLSAAKAMGLFFFSMLYLLALFGAITADVLLIS